MASPIIPKIIQNDANGLPAVGWKLNVYEVGTTTPKASYTDAALTTLNTVPIVLDSLGMASLYYAGKAKLVMTDAADVTQWTEQSVVSTDGVGIATTLVAMKATNTSIGSVYVQGRTAQQDGYEGNFQWRTGDYTTQIAADTTEAIYVKADGIATTVGAWVRDYSGKRKISWFGFSASAAAAANKTAWQGANDFGSGTIIIHKGNFNVDRGIVQGSDIALIGQGASEYFGTGATRIVFSGTGVGLLVSGDNGYLDGINFDGNDTGGDNIQVTGSRFRWGCIGSHQAGGQGFLIGEDVLVIGSNIAINAITKANPGVITTTSPHGLTGSTVADLSSIGGMIELNNDRFRLTVTGASTLSLQDRDGVNLDTSGYTTYTTGGNLQEVTGTSSINANLWKGDHLITTNNGGKGFAVNHKHANVAGNYPDGLPDVNAGSVSQIDSRSNAGDGIYLGNCIDNVLTNPVSQGNTGYGIHLDKWSRGHMLPKVYTENNTAGEGFIHVNATQNRISSNRAATFGSGWTNNAGSSNLITFYKQSIGKNADSANASAAGWVTLEEINVDGLTEADTGYYVGGSEMARWRAEVDTGSGGKITLRTKRNGNTPLDRMVVRDNGYVQFTNGLVLTGKSTADTTTTGLTLYESNGRIDFVNSPSGSQTCAAFYDASGFAGGISTDGAGTTSYATTSDRRLKNHIGEASCIEILKKISPYLMSMKSNDKNEFIGMYAQDIIRVAPWAVLEVDGVLSVDYSKLVPILWGALADIIKNNDRC